MIEDAPILRRLGKEDCYRIFTLDKNEVSIGSSEDATYSISSSELSQCLVVIRRRHDETWTITDIMSSNGIYLNGHHLVPLSSYTIQDGDVVLFGAPAFSRGQGRFEYKFCSSVTVENILQNNMSRELEENIKEIEQQLRKHDIAIETNNKIQELKVKKKELEQQLRNQTLAMEMILMDRQSERESLLAEIDKSHKESNEAKRQALQVKGDVLSNFTELMDVTVQCSICTDYFIKATSLNCSHVFCNLCINEWMKVKKLCPNCRTPITTVTAVPALDKCVDRMVEQFGDDVRGRRQELINHRKIAEKKTAGADARAYRPLDGYLGVYDGMEPIAAIVREIAHVALAHTRPAVIRRTAALARAEVMRHARALRRSETARKAAAYTKKTLQIGAQAFTNAKAKILAGSAVCKRALTLTKAAAMTKSKEITKSATFRRAVALTKAAAITGAKTLGRSSLIRRAAELARRTAAEIKTYAIAGVATLKHSDVYKRTLSLAQEVQPQIRRAVGTLGMQSEIFRNAAQLF